MPDRYLLQKTDVRFDCIDRATRFLEVLNAYPEVILQDPGGVEEYPAGLQRHDNRASKHR